MMAFDLESLTRSILVLGDDVRVEVGRLAVLGRGDDGRMGPKSMAVLIELARHPMTTVTRAELLDRVWPDSMPTPDALSHAVRELRRALGDNAKASTIVETVHGVGYRLMLPVGVESIGSAPVRIQPAHLPAAVEPVPVSAIDPNLEAVGSDAASSAASPGAELQPVVVVPSPAASPRASRPMVLGAALLLVFALVAVAWALAQRFTPVSPSWPDELSARLITSEPGAEEFPKLSPDGATVVFTRRVTADGRYDLAVMSVTATQPRPLTDTETIDEIWPVWSPDGTSIAYLEIDGESCRILVIPATGGASRRIGDCDRIVFSAMDWSADGSHLLTSLPSPAPGRELRIHRISVTGGSVAPLDYSSAEAGWDRDPVYSPDGTLIAFRRGLPPDYDVFVVPAAGGEARRLTRFGSVIEGLTWSPDGREVLFASHHEGAPAIYRVDVGTSRVRTTGLTDASHPNVARDGSTLVFQRPRLRVGMIAADVRDPSVPPEPVAPATGSVGFIASSPDRRLLAYVSDRGGFEQVWIHEPGTDAERAYGDASLRRITSLGWSDDGRQLLVVVRRGDADEPLVLDVATGTFSDLGLTRPLLRDAVMGVRPDRVYAIVEGDDRPVLARFDRAEGGWKETRGEIPANQIIRVPGVPGVLARTQLRDELILEVNPDLASREIQLQPRVFGWTAADGAIWYLSTPERAKLSLRRFDLASGEDVHIRDVPHHVPRRRATVAMLGDRVVFGVLVEDAADLAIVEGIQGVGAN